MINQQEQYNVEDYSSKDHMENFPIGDRLQLICGSVRIPSLNENIPEKVTQREMKEAANRYEQADIQWKNSCKRRDLGEKEDAGDHLYRLVRGLLKRGAFYAWKDGVLDSWAEGKDVPNPDDSDTGNG